MKPASGPIAQVTAAEVSRNFGLWQDRAIAGPVVVTHHGRPRVVIVSADAYAGLSKPGPGADFGTKAGGDLHTSLSAVLDHVSDGFVSLCDDLRIASANKVAAAYFNLSVERMVGQPLSAILPDPVQGPVLDHCRRVLRSGETVTFEIRGSEDSGRHILIAAFPYPGGVGLSFSNRTELRALQDYTADLNAIRTALSAHAGVSFVTLNVRGGVSGCSEGFAAMSGRRPEDLHGHPFAGLAPAADRDRVAAAVDRVLDTGEVVRLDATVLILEGRERAVCMTMAPVLREGTPQGVSVVLSPLDEQAAA